MVTKTTSAMRIDKQQAAFILAGSIALILGSVALVGVDYTDVRKQAALVPLNAQRIDHIETTMREASREQTDATKELSKAVSELRETIAELKGRTKP